MKKRILLLLLTLCLVLTACAGGPSPAPASTSIGTPATSEQGERSNFVPQTGEEWMRGNTENLICCTVEEVLQGKLNYIEDGFGGLAYSDETTANMRTAYESGHVYNTAIGTSFTDFGVDYTIQDVWYETTIDNMLPNYYETTTDMSNFDTYIYIAFKVENRTDIDRTFYINNGTIVAYPEEALSQDSYPVYHDQVIDPFPQNTGYMLCALAAGETNTYTVAYGSGKGFRTYDPIYLNWYCLPPEEKTTIPDTEPESAYEIWIKLPTLEKRG